MHCSDYKIVQERRTSIEPQQQTHRLPPKKQQITLRGFFLKVTAKANGVLSSICFSSWCKIK